MARTSVKATYALDVESVRALEKMARRWEVSKSEALRRAIHAAAAAQARDGGQGLDALDRLQRSLALTPARARAWVREVRVERRATGPRRAAEKRR
jgi:hypothetical protein